MYLFRDRNTPWRTLSKLRSPIQNGLGLRKNNNHVDSVYPVAWTSGNLIGDEVLYALYGNKNCQHKSPFPATTFFFFSAPRGYISRMLRELRLSLEQENKKSWKFIDSLSSWNVSSGGGMRTAVADLKTECGLQLKNTAFLNLIQGCWRVKILLLILFRRKIARSRLTVST